MTVALKEAGRWLLDAVLPPRCLSCGGLVGDPGALCPTCWEGLSFLAPPFCAACGHPFDVDAGDGALCGHCLREPPPYARARSVLRYDDAAKPLLLSFKHADRLDGAPAFGRWMARAGGELLADADLILPVPLHRWRLFSRRYNQSAVLALAIGREAGVAVDPALLVRKRATPPQGERNRAERQRNVRGAFTLRRGRDVAGKNLLLVDDVLTTGATAAECTRVLLAAGATRVDLLTLARVVLAYE